MTTWQKRSSCRLRARARRNSVGSFSSDSTARFCASKGTISAWCNWSRHLGNFRGNSDYIHASSRFKFHLSWCHTRNKIQICFYSLFSLHKHQWNQWRLWCLQVLSPAEPRPPARTGSEPTAESASLLLMEHCKISPLSQTPLVEFTGEECQTEVFGGTRISLIMSVYKNITFAE